IMDKLAPVGLGPCEAIFRRTLPGEIGIYIAQGFEPDLRHIAEDRAYMAPGHRMAFAHEARTDQCNAEGCHESPHKWMRPTTSATEDVVRAAMTIGDKKVRSRLSPGPAIKTIANRPYLNFPALSLVTSTVPVSMTASIFSPFCNLTRFSTARAPMFLGAW